MVCLSREEVDLVVTWANGIVSYVLNNLFTIVNSRESFEFKREIMTISDDVTYSNSTIQHLLADGMSG